MKNLISLIVSSCILMSSSLSYGKESPKPTAPGKTGFHDVCPGLFKIADDFAKECLEKARPYGRVFLPVHQKETHAAYFREIDSGSHFSLGCTLDQNHKIRFLGIYYSTKSSSFKVANTAPFEFIDFNGNVGINVDGKPVVLIAVRRFVTDFIPSPYKEFDPKLDPDAVPNPNSLPPVKNCENEQVPDGRIRMNNGGAYKIVETKDEQGNIIINGYEGDTPAYYGQYYRFFPSKQRQIIYDGGAGFWYITAGGDLLVKKSILEEYCTPLHSVSYDSLFHEACGLTPSQN